MKITRDVYTQLMKLPKVPPENGGILGGNGIINTWVLDTKRKNSHEGRYEPNEKILNLTINEWIEKGIDFMGIFHTHSLEWESLSNTDIAYILCIMNSMPEYIEKLYFPLVYPSHFIKGFYATRKNGQIHINEEDVEII